MDRQIEYKRLTVKANALQRRFDKARHNCSDVERKLIAILDARMKLGREIAASEIAASEVRT